MLGLRVGNIDGWVLCEGVTAGKDDTVGKADVVGTLVGNSDVLSEGLFVATVGPILDGLDGNSVG